MATRLTLFLLSLSALALAACKREEAEPDHDHGDDHPVHTVDLRIKFVFKHGTHDYELASEYVDHLDHLYKIDTLRFLLSGLDVIDDGSAVLATYPDVRLLVDAAGTNDFALGSLTAAHGHQIRFTLGLSPALNDSDPTTAPAPLNDQTMHWGMGADEGYWFLVVKGRVDSNGDQLIDGNDNTFNYRCGTDALARAGWALMHAEIPDGGTFTVETAVDVERLLNGVDVLSNTSAIGDTPLNVQLMDSLQAIFHESH